MCRIKVFMLMTLWSALSGLYSQVTNIPLYKNLSYKECNVSDYASSIRYVPLETKDECLLNEELQVIVSSQYIFIHDFLADKVYRFDANNGKFLNTIGKRGQGPGEYQKLFGIYVDDVYRKCYLMDSYANKIYIYDYNGKYVKVCSGSLADKSNEKLFDYFWELADRVVQPMLDAGKVYPSPEQACFCAFPPGGNGPCAVNRPRPLLRATDGI